MRITQLVLFSFAVIAMAVAATWAVMHLREGAQEPPPPEAATGADGVLCPDEGAKPAEAGEVEVVVRNGTPRSGLANTVGEDLSGRGYQVGDPRNTSEADGPVTVVYGPEGLLAAYSVGAQFDDVSYRVDDRDNEKVDVLLGEEYGDIASEKNAKERLGKAVPVPEGCPGTDADDGE